jgi:hypothetical protein
MRRTPLAGAVRPLWLAAFAACATTAMVPADGWLNHRRHGFAVADLALEGWQRIDVEEADVAFTRPGQGVIALRSSCGKHAPAPAASTRALWHGIERDGASPQRRRVGEREALEFSLDRDGLRVRTLALRTADCALDFVQVAPPDADPAVLDRFAAGLRESAAP